MAFSFLKSKARGKTRDQIFAIDLGERTTKAAFVQRVANEFALCRYALVDAPIFEKTLSVEMLTDHLKAVAKAADCKCKMVSLLLGVNDSLVRNTEMPNMPPEDMRQILKHSSKNFLQQDLPNHVFDCYAPAPPEPKPGEKPKAGGGGKHKVLVAAARKQLVDQYTTAAKNAGMVAEHVMPGLIGPLNTFEVMMPEVFTRQTVALVDIGFKSTTICISQEGNLVLSRVVSIGGDRLTNGLVDSMGVNYGEAENLKLSLTPEAQTILEALVIPLGRELRASIDFFEHQADKTVSKVYISGGSSKSEVVVQILQSELMIECESWKTMTPFQIVLPPEQASELENVGPRLNVAIGGALAAL